MSNKNTDFKVKENDVIDSGINNTIKYINQSLSDLNILEKQEILQMIINSIDDKKIQTKGDGTQIRYADIPKNILQNISNYIKVQLEKKLEKIENFPNK